VSPLQLQEPSLPELIARVAKETRFDLSRLTVEITESALLKNVMQAKAIADDLKALGMKLSLDDFGTGYSSLSQLQMLPFDELKVDRSFVATMCSRPESRKIVANVIGLGRSLGLRTVAEGVENIAQAEMLRALGCEVAQGRLYGKALLVPDLGTSLLSKHKPAKLLEIVSEIQNAPNVSLEALPSVRFAQLQTIYDGFPVGLCFLDCELRYISLNQHLANMNGVPVIAHLGKTVAEMVPEVFEQLRPFLLRAIQGEAIGALELQSRTAGAAHQTSTFQLTCQPASDEGGEIVGISVAIVDISERKKTELARQESLHNLRHRVEPNPNILWTMDGHGMVLDVSPHWEVITGLNLESSEGLGWLDAVHPDDKEFLWPNFFECIRSGNLELEFRIGSEEKAWHWMRSRGTPRYDRTGRIVRWYGSLEFSNFRRELTEAPLDHRSLLPFQISQSMIMDGIPCSLPVQRAVQQRIHPQWPAVWRPVCCRQVRPMIRISRSLHQSDSRTSRGASGT